MMLRSQKYNDEPRQCACYAAYSWLERQEMVMRLVLFFCHEVVCQDFVIGAMAAILKA